MSTSVSIEFASGTFSGEQIKFAVLFEEINPVSVELPSSTLRFSVLASGTFSIVDSSGFLASLQYRQPLDVYENVTGSVIYMGRFYLDSWESLSEHEARFEASDGVALLDFQYFGELYAPEFGVDTADEVAGDIFSNVTVGYAMDSALQNTTILGWIPITTGREALQQLCFRLGAFATSTRDDTVNIRQTELASDLGVFDHVITSAQKGLGQPLTLRTIVTEVNLKSHDYFNYTVPSPQPELFSATLQPGQYTILFSKAKFGTGIGGTATYNLDVVEANRWVVTILTAGTFVVTLTGDARDDTRTVTVENEELPGTTATNALAIADALLIPYSQAETVAQRVYDYYQQRYVQKVKLYRKNVAVGDTALVYSQGRWIAGVVERTEIDLAGGFVTIADVVGVVYGCANVLSEDTTVLDGDGLSYVGCLDMLDFNLTLQGEATLTITD